MHADQFHNLDYLSTGKIQQQAAYNLLLKYNLFGILQAFDPILAGTVPINIDIENSDLDIICCFTNKADFKNIVALNFSALEGFKLTDTIIDQQETIMVNFSVDGWPVEVFGQDIPTRQQNAYKHMVVEHLLLEHYGEPFRQQVIELKKQGYKTEPAFARLLGLNGDPYLELLNPALISSLTDKK
ncbi:DUF4269 domain-containing protein [Mucilaginibacter sp. HC2]|uniref:DUF4269 domain-containing protein n=1 Tax=Mucilaginibacter inviolabilis TaxID=2714892 RepID=UPI00140E68A9|nr:DUF4269 domain-containing protein [Mucilaginibacter inviolabilis]NHA06124.1 DUF4269 domain-containing protein [Mucilaginibacter inviolabilis]